MKNKIKKIFISAAILFTLESLFSCSKKAIEVKTSIVCTTFPEYDWIINILGEKKSDFNVTLLQNKGTDLHSYQPSIDDIAKISNADLFVYVGGENDQWAEKVIANARNKKQISINLMEVLGDKIREEEIVEGMQAEEEHVHKEELEHEKDTEYDEHIWLSLNNAIILTKALAKEIVRIDSDNASIYEKNSEEYIGILSNLDSKYKTAVCESSKKTILFGDRYPFRYLSDDYELNYYAAFVGCSAESEANFETIIFLANKADELGLSAILTIEKNDGRIARTIIESTKNKNLQILAMDSLQSVTEQEIIDGRNYISAMENNLEVLKKALN